MMLPAWVIGRGVPAVETAPFRHLLILLGWGGARLLRVTTKRACDYQ